VSVTPSVNVTAQPLNVTLSAWLTDNLSGVGSAVFTYACPVNVNASNITFVVNSQNRVSGNLLAGNYVVSQTIYPGTFPCNYFLANVSVSDLSSFGRATPTVYVYNLTSWGSIQISGVVDVIPPALVSFSISPSTANTTVSSQILSLSLTMTDNVLVQKALVTGSWRGGQSTTFTITNANRVAGTNLYLYNWVLPQGTQPGQWSIMSVLVSDYGANTVLYRAGVDSVLSGSNVIVVIVNCGPATPTTAPTIAPTIVPTAAPHASMRNLNVYLVLIILFIVGFTVLAYIVHKKGIIAKYIRGNQYSIQLDDPRPLP